VGTHWAQIIAVREKKYLTEIRKLEELAKVV